MIPTAVAAIKSMEPQNLIKQSFCYIIVDLTKQQVSGEGVHSVENKVVPAYK